MPRATVVPKGDGARCPLKAGSVFYLHRMGVKIIKQRFAFFCRPTLKMQRKARIDVKRLAPAFGVRDDHRMHGVLGGIFGFENRSFIVSR